MVKSPEIELPIRPVIAPGMEYKLVPVTGIHYHGRELLLNDLAGQGWAFFACDGENYILWRMKPVMAG
jgi:hypothetical protein